MSASALPYRPHNHDACVHEALSDARRICRDRQARLTPTRERVLELIWQSHKPLGAYDLLGLLAEDGHNAAPPTVYRALDFLLQNGLVHRIASLNAFVGCAHADKHHHGLFLICRVCRNVLELTDPTVSEALTRASTGQAFSAEDITVEVAGLCPACQEQADHD
ncbi:MAG: Fur family transcriptional regulator [Marinobacter sp.]|uniref:Fur family transcriptional regulator n=1 Tax=Marinobacter sp. TaxID=50741 RepID=UPI00299EE5D8|nr:Fur family transcriptional regulator [Marinobacter sp.]MDX1635494.1 Fur family transcriptional regulator [Marinobacter sp.]